MIRIYPARRAGGGERGNLGSPLTYFTHLRYTTLK